MVSIKAYTLKGDEKLLKEFNGGKYSRKNYRWLYKVKIKHGKMMIFVATPSLKQALYSMVTLWSAHEGDSYDSHNHPVMLQAYDVRPSKEADKLEVAAAKLAQKQVKRHNKAKKV